MICPSDNLMKSKTRKRKKKTFGAKICNNQKLDIVDMADEMRA